jgi:hypothetical protein
VLSRARPYLLMAGDCTPGDGSLGPLAPPLREANRLIVVRAAIRLTIRGW